MRDETRKWVEYANENLYSAKILLESKLFNPCLQNVQQAIEKILKAMLVESDVKFLKTHSITELVGLLAKAGVSISITPDSCELLDSIYLPSKYPFGGVLPDFEPDEDTCRGCIAIVEQVFESVEKNML